MTPARTNLIAVAAALLVVSLLSGSAGAQEARVQAGDGVAPSALRQIEALLAAKAQRTPAQRKVSPQLLDVSAGERPVPVPAPSTVGPAPSAVASEEDDSSNWAEVDIRAEGTAMLEVVHDLAPGADLFFEGPRLHRLGIGRDVQLRWTPQDLLQAERYTAHPGGLLLDRRRVVAEARRCGGGQRVDFDPRLLYLQGHVGRGARWLSARWPT